MDIEKVSMEALKNVKEKLTNNTIEHKEGKISKFIEARASKLPTDVFFWSSLVVMGTSLTLKLLKREKMSLFVGQWAASFLLMGVYNKLVKLHGSER